MLNSNGYSVAVVSSTMNKTFSEGAGLKFPGYVPDDVAAVRRALKLILKDIGANTKLAPKRVVVGGYSLGGLHTLHLAALEAKENTLGVDRFVALNPPVDLLYAMNRFEGKSSETIAEELNLSRRTVENHLFLSRKEIRTYIKQCI